MPQGKPENVPDDGLTTRARRARPLLIVHTGPGKGKSTAAFGMALRAWNQGWPIGVFQFVKSAKWRVGEERALRVLGASGEGGTVAWHKMGEGWSWLRHRGSEEDHAAAAREGWEQIKRDLAAETYRFYVLDEFTYPMAWGWVDVDDVVAALAARPGTQHVVITGRNAAPALVEAADLVTEMGKVRHPMDSGQKGQKGIEW
ncbi:cob(I)alamin adenosyltransferase [Thermocatellispora tengchongensis]|uniref:Cob(I)alamin adenosyltransferase n=1 Tax=Thermocatellispora tengchongensis TaxID=1073253 RepID=A0A840P9V4_9ACTN|nr:cob(I)yrinic acid a,c-diamide adenosyltransferase [Thermocatellispora tengchongensis]MBB5136428.1 cob(I)alamin adenosyltransferase [Thermocatellispora tengchongensis]